MKLLVLGSSAGGGFPQWNCNCANCAAVRRGSTRHHARTQSSVAVGGPADWLEQELTKRPGVSHGSWDRTVVVTHFAPSLKSADPRYGGQPGTASFCNADDDLIVKTDLWLHGHLHCRHDYTVARPGRRPSRVVCQARGLAHKGEAEGLDVLRLIEI